MLIIVIVIVIIIIIIIIIIRAPAVCQARMVLSTLHALSYLIFTKAISQ